LLHVPGAQHDPGSLVCWQPYRVPIVLILPMCSLI
jgi:hypothetical protein